MKNLYSQQALDSISDAISQDVHRYMQYGGYMPCTATDIYDLLMAIGHDDFVQVLKGGVVPQKDALLAFELLDAPFQPRSDQRVVAMLQNAHYAFTLVYDKMQNADVPSGYLIYIQLK